MEKFLGKWSPYFFALLRIVAGVMFAMHGSQKLFGWPGKEAQPLMSQMGLAGVIEFFGGLMIAVGLFTSWAALLCSLLMVAAYFIAHAPQGPLPILNGGELAVLYFVIFLFIAAHGAGVWSVDAAMGRGASGRRFGLFGARK